MAAFNSCYLFGMSECFSVCILLYILHNMRTASLFTENPSGRRWWCSAYWYWCGIGDVAIWWSRLFARWCGKLDYTFLKIFKRRSSYHFFLN